MQEEQARRRGRDTNRDTPGDDQRRTPRLLEFGDWGWYIGEFPPVLLIRVTPRLVEGFWTTVARGAARTQGVAVPPIKHFKPGLSRLRAFCGDAEVTPIHPFKLEQRISETDAIFEGLYVFDPGAFGPQCGTVELRADFRKGTGQIGNPSGGIQTWSSKSGTTSRLTARFRTDLFDTARAGWRRYDRPPPSPLLGSIRIQRPQAAMESTAGSSACAST